MCTRSRWEIQARTGRCWIRWPLKSLVFLRVLEFFLRTEENRTWCFHCWGPGSIPSPGTKIPPTKTVFCLFCLLTVQEAERCAVLEWDTLGIKSSCLSYRFQSLSCVQFFATPWAAARQASLSFTISLSLLKLMSVELVMPSNHLILCVFHWEVDSSHCVTNVLELQLQYSSFSEYSGLISFRID